MFSIGLALSGNASPGFRRAVLAPARPPVGRSGASRREGPANAPLAAHRGGLGRGAGSGVPPRPPLLTCTIAPAPCSSLPAPVGPRGQWKRQPVTSPHRVAGGCRGSVAAGPLGPSLRYTSFLVSARSGLRGFPPPRRGPVGQRHRVGCCTTGPAPRVRHGCTKGGRAGPGRLSSVARPSQTCMLLLSPIRPLALGPHRARVFGSCARGPASAFPTLARHPPCHAGAQQGQVAPAWSGPLPRSLPPPGPRRWACRARLPSAGRGLAAAPRGHSPPRARCAHLALTYLGATCGLHSAGPKGLALPPHMCYTRGERSPSWLKSKHHSSAQRLAVA